MANISEILNRDHRTTSYTKNSIDHKLQRSDDNALDNLENCDKCQNKSHSDKKSNQFAKTYTKIIGKSKLN